MSKEICILNGTKWILGDESTEPMNWEDANKWCKSIGQDLPPREVLLMAFLNPEIRSNFANNLYWSSSEDDSNFAWTQSFNNSNQYNNNKSHPFPVRAVRAISAEASEQTEQEPVAWMFGNKLYKKLYGKNHLSLEERNSFIPLYLAPPTREPLSDGITADMYRANKKATHPDSYWAGVCDAEKAHGIGVD